MKGLFPFRIGSTSYIIPDDILPNVRLMAPLVDDIELVLFESNEISNFPSKEVIKELARIGKDERITYTIHFPIDKKAGSIDISERKRFSEQACRIIDIMSCLDPWAYLLHLEGVTAQAKEGEIFEWQKRVAEVCAMIQSKTAPYKVSAESLAYPVSWLMPMVLNFGFSTCLDIGHLWLNGQNVTDAFQTVAKTLRVIHLHGVSGDIDHISLINSVLNGLSEVISNISSVHFCGVITLEVFNVQDLHESMRILQICWEKECRK